MAFIEKENPVVLNIKLTSYGRNMLSKGKLNFKNFAIGDSEIDYEFINNVKAVSPNYMPNSSMILSAIDVNPNIISFITKNVSGATYSSLPTDIPSITYQVTNNISSIGFFNSDCSAFLYDSSHVKQPDAMIYTSGLTTVNNKTLYLFKSPSYGPSGEEPSIGDILLVKWTLSGNTAVYSIDKTKPAPYLFYKITSKTGTLSANNLVVGVDRNLPNFSGYTPNGIAGAMIYYSGNSAFTGGVINYSPTDYIEKSVLTFFSNSQCDTAVFPFWNMSIIYTDEIAGITGDTSNKKYTQFKSRNFGGFVSYIQNQSSLYKKLGIIHYTNSSPANVYGEGFYLNTPELNIPTIMWHKSTGSTLGLKLVANGPERILTGATKSLNLVYYNLSDLSGNIVGKIFTDLKIFVIEDQELLFALSYKSNRSWTLPNYLVSGGNAGCV